MRVGFHIWITRGLEACMGQLSDHVFTSFQKKTHLGIAKKVRQPEKFGVLSGIDPEGEPVRRSQSFDDQYENDGFAMTCRQRCSSVNNS